MNWLRRFMYGRNGTDQLNFALLVLSVILCVVTAFFTNMWVRMIVYIPLAWGIFRMLSKNLVARRAENYKFLIVWQKIKGFFTGIAQRTKDKEHRYFKCPSCKSVVRVPRGKGKIVITCPKCRTRFEKKS